ncbi:hypothetical protein D7O42_14060 [Salmonella enterica subsp. enterica serovar Montevideo]|nr:hypothetical protein [Salmonella enterica subsp. enterica serovar Anatum]EBZ1035471.1 hypothetical protein [Salmonella enterica subsp. enterica serovar Montevideo]ECD5141919.1 hypothetical protein [Salmonella enterica subsp. enterica serovar Caracas]EHK0685530.1 hypothetical protein [Salmonella enterica subsp. enterica serovar Kingston]
MEIIDKKYNGKEETTAFHLKSSGKIVSRLLSTKLDRDDWEIIHNLLHFVYSQGVEAGSKSRAKEIRIALGLEVD